MSTKNKFCYKRLAGELSKWQKNPIEGIEINPTKWYETRMIKIKHNRLSCESVNASYGNEATYNHD